MIEIAEEWRPIPEWDGFYEASSLGRVRSVSRLVQFQNRRGTDVQRWLTGRILKPCPNKRGYLGVILSAGEGSFHREVHVLVCAAFHGERPTGLQAAHRDGVTSNCRADNLRWATTSENARDRELHGTAIKGELHARAVLSAAKVAEIRSSSGKTMREIGRMYGIAPQTAWKIATRKSWKHVA